MSITSSLAQQRCIKFSNRSVLLRGVCQRKTVRAKAQQQIFNPRSQTNFKDGFKLSRRELTGGSLLGMFVTPMAAQAAKLKGYIPTKDGQDGYQFVYPFGWQELQVDGQDILFKDVIEPLEAVSVSFVPTEKSDVSDFGDLNEVTSTLARSVLSSPQQEVEIINQNESVAEGIRYYTVEFQAKARNYIRHSIAVIAVANGKFYTLTTGANERRWNKMKDKIKTVANSFSVFPVFS
eukprot:TRINITY_DN5047_c0_g1_i1.p1 TRINITY_DN5047_c0_g1~~TRINITY_DN5047_c0_g1_i1.p1  ORF type:complete len:254 (+),score=22.45 TRINITY_DN5047_c0_g1_i1:58-762(+)